MHICIECDYSGTAAAAAVADAKDWFEPLASITQMDLRRFLFSFSLFATMQIRRGCGCVCVGGEFSPALLNLLKHLGLSPGTWRMRMPGMRRHPPISMCASFCLPFALFVVRYRFTLFFTFFHTMQKWKRGSYRCSLWAFAAPLGPRCVHTVLEQTNALVLIRGCPPTRQNKQ